VLVWCLCVCVRASASASAWLLRALCIRQAGVRDKLKIIAAGKVLTGFSVIRTLVRCLSTATALPL
jgi:hypothetical protein